MQLYRYSLALVLALASIHAYANDARPIIEVGGGALSNPRQSETSFLIRAALNHTGEGPEDDDKVWWYFAHVRADLAITPGSGGTRVPYLDVEFVPVHAGFNTDAGAHHGLIRFLPSRFNRNVELKQDFGMRMSAIGFDVSYSSSETDESTALIFVRGVVDLLGARLITHGGGDAAFSGASHLAGAHFIGGDVSVGLQIRPADGFRVRLEMGVRGDLSIVGDQGAYRRLTDTMTYGRIRADLTEFFSLFVEASQSATSIGHSDEDAPFANRVGFGGLIRY